MHEKIVKKAYFIADRKFLRSYGMSMALPWPYPIWNVLRQGYLIPAKTVQELTGKDWHSSRRTGEDSERGK
jgi:hypothetical protein